MTPCADYAHLLKTLCLIHGWHQTGLTIIDAAEKVTEYKFVNDRLGKRSGRWRELTDIGPTVRTTFYKFRKDHANFDQLFELWRGAYSHWCRWVTSATFRALRFVVKKYRELGQSENAKVFLLLARKVRPRSALQNRQGIEKPAGDGCI